MMKRTLGMMIAVAVVFAASNAYAALPSIGWNMQGVGGVGLNPGDTAGAPGYAQDNWNNHSSAGQAPGSTPFGPLNDDSGTPTGVSVTGWSQSANNSWQYQETATPDQILLNDFANQDPTITFSDVNDFTANGYTVVVYYGNNEFANGGGTLDVNGIQQDIKANGAFSATGYVLNTDNGATGSNYAVFTGVSGDVLTVALDSIQNDGISAIQIIAIPEPASIALIGLGGLMMLRRRRSN